MASGSTKQPFQVAVDGPAASGKSSTAQAVASRLNLTYIDTGALYRALTLKARAWNLDPERDALAIAKLAKQTKFAFRTAEETMTVAGVEIPKTIVYLDGKDVSKQIRLPSLTKTVAPFANIPEVRDVLKGKALALAAGEDGGLPEDGKQIESEPQTLGVIMDGRDIATNVLSNAQVKIFLEGDPTVRAKRRLEDLRQAHKDVPSLDDVVADIRNRDLADTKRAVDPLVKAEDAVVLDTSELTLQEQIDAVADIARKSMLAHGIPADKISSI
ncbi:cytidylate kinase [Fimicolochytrium jonesii]|uniref:cytidylate kinase n=1 Tax=Fimicolochytrium jonesii TaxID=1396493 RepID=UPI0022FDED88|nr:cytidylate kinase [Fimicolochytrium jonesii]KAI8824242.1 cytidylate kinase [Fimicolochytrium jonesii]